jgi:hypothetical protein
MGLAGGHRKSADGSDHGDDATKSRGWTGFLLGHDVPPEGAAARVAAFFIL